MKFNPIVQMIIPVLCLAVSASAQPRPEVAPGQNGGVFPLPEGVSRVISIDAHNTIVAELEAPQGEAKTYAAFPIRHVYSGGIARVFGGEVVPAEIFVSPAFANGNSFGNGTGNNFNGPQSTSYGGNGNNNFNNNGNNSVGNINSGRIGLSGNRQFSPRLTRRGFNRVLNQLDRPIASVGVGQ